MRPGVVKIGMLTDGISSMFRAAVLALAAFALLDANPLMAAEQVGEAVVIKTAVTGQGGPLAVRSAVHRDERIRTSNSGLGQFVFRDGTKLAVGWGSSVVIDKFVFDDTRSVKKLTIKAAKGTFRWISGNSVSSAYEIVTPAGTIGVRGTAFDFSISANGTTAVVLLSGSAEFCGSNGCRQLTQRCDCVIATRANGVSDPRRVDRSVLRTLGSGRALPFLSGNQTLSGGFQSSRDGCGLTMASVGDRGQDRMEPAPEPPTSTTPDRPSPPDTPDQPEKPDQPDKPDRPDKPDKPDRPDKPDKPGNPDKPDKPEKPDKPSKPDKPGKPDRPDKPDKPDKDRHGKPDKPHKTDRSDWHDRHDRHERPETHDKHDRAHHGSFEKGAGFGKAADYGRSFGRHGRDHGDYSNHGAGDHRGSR